MPQRLGWFRLTPTVEARGEGGADETGNLQAT